MNKAFDKISSVGLTPRGEKMPQTVAEWQYLYGLAEQTMLADKEEISRQTERVSQDPYKFYASLPELAYGLD